jgi:hypothetical protein
MTRSIIIAASILTLSASASFAQTAAPATAAPKQPAPAAAAATATAPAVAPVGSVARNVATSAAAARTAYESGIRARQATCTAKGGLYKWVPPHVAGDANPKGGFYTTTFGGGCRKVGLGEAIASGAVIVKQ